MISWRNAGGRNRHLNWVAVVRESTSVTNIQQYFDTDFSHCLNAGNSWRFVDQLGVSTDVRVRLHMDFEANASFLSCLLPESPRWSDLLASVLRDAPRFVRELSGGVGVKSGRFEERPMSSEDLRFCGRFFVYTEHVVPGAETDRIAREWIEQGLLVQVRDGHWVAERARTERPLAFICHDSRDKEVIARPLAYELTRLVCPVWYDEYSLKVGDRLRESIERGLKECKKCILIVSPNWLANNGWSKTEFDSIFTREHVEGGDVFLPIWCGVTTASVYQYSPSLANRYALQWSAGIPAIAGALRRAIV